MKGSGGNKKLNGGIEMLKVHEKKKSWKNMQTQNKENIGIKM